MNYRSLLLLVVAVAAARANVIKSSFAEQSVFTKGKLGKLGIFDGTKTTIQKHPYMVSLSFMGSVFGAATILSNSYVLTTADVVTEVKVSEITVVAGSTTPSGAEIAVESVTTHPGYGTNLYDYDFAILKLATNLTYSSKIKAITLPTKDPKANTALTVTGWGFSNQTQTGPTMRQGTMSWLATKTCKKTFIGTGVTWTSRMACAYDKGKTTLCYNDYGDPFVRGGVIYGMFINGPASGGNFCTTSAAPVLLADVYSVVAWIKSTTSIE